MDTERFDRVTRKISSRFNASTARRTLLQHARLLGLAAIGVSATAGESEAKGKKKKKKKKKCKDCCLANGSSCNKASAKCNAKLCLSTPFTIEAHWTNVDSDHDTYVLVPNQSGASLPAPFVNYQCNPADSACESNLYPFICVSQDAQGPGDEVTTVRKLLPGKYEYWIELEDPSPAGDLTVTLRRPNGTVVRSWSSPPNPSASQVDWHVFDIDGTIGSIASIDQAIAGGVPADTDVCP